MKGERQTANGKGFLFFLFPLSSSFKMAGLFFSGLALLALFALQPFWETVLRGLYPLETKVVHETPLLQLVWVHLALLLASSALSVLFGVGLGALVTRGAWREFLPLVLALSSLAQVFPPVAVLALSYPVLGFGFAPTVLALSLYGLLPIISGTIAGLENVDNTVLEAATGLGMEEGQLFWRVALPLALPSVLGGVRTSVVINVGTAAIGAAIGAGGLGLPIFAGLESQNFALVLQGAVPVMLLALWLDAALNFE
jgi:osmoprotectant transport system permease protein